MIDDGSEFGDLGRFGRRRASLAPQLSDEAESREEWLDLSGVAVGMVVIMMSGIYEVLCNYTHLVAFGFSSVPDPLWLFLNISFEVLSHCISVTVTVGNDRT